MRPSLRWLNKSGPLVNQLAKSNNPYLQSHKSNPVAWQEWNKDALSLAVTENKPIFLSIGYHTCHWCHVMNAESFANERIAGILNKSFIPIKLDREQRPDIDAVYMMYLQATTGQGGWPLNVFLVPGTLDPIYGGTYFAGPDAAGGSSARSLKFEDVLNRVSQVWSEDSDNCRRSAKSIADKLSGLVKAQSNATSAVAELSMPLILSSTREYFENHFDPYNGGYSAAPKFPCPHNISFLLRHARDLCDSETGANQITDSAVLTLTKIGQGGIKDQLGHGFSRYSVTEDWNLPHFEKMLYDQALLLHAYLDALVYGGKSETIGRKFSTDIVDFLQQGSLFDPSTGAFYSGQDADSENPVTGKHTEGAYYVWSYDEFFMALKPLGLMDSDICAMFWGVEEIGNVDPQHDAQGELRHQNVLSQGDIVSVASAFGKQPQYVQKVVDQSRELLNAYRQNHRQPPTIDTKFVSGWNGLAAGALARAGLVLGNSSAVRSAKRAVQYILDACWNAESKRLWRIAGSTTPGMADDYGYMVWGLLELYEATSDTQYLRYAVNIQASQLELFWDAEHGGFFSATETSEQPLMFRPKAAFDAAEPSPNSVSLRNLVRLWSITGSSDYERKARQTLKCYSEDIAAQPFGYCGMVSQAIALDSIESYVVVGGSESSANEAIAKITTDNTNAEKTIVRIDKNSIDYLSTFQDQVYKELYDKHKSDEKPSIMKCKGQSCRYV